MYKRILLKTIVYSSYAMLAHAMVLDTAETHRAELHLSAELGEAPAQIALGKLFLDGIGVPKDLAEAYKWFNAAAELGNHEGIYLVGMCYEYGLGVPQDEIKAIMLYVKVVEHVVDAVMALRAMACMGNESARYQLAILYEQGRGVEKNMDCALSTYASMAPQLLEAFERLQKHAEAGNAEALWWLGVAYEKGRGVPQSSLRAKEYYTRAAEKGDRKSVFELAMLCETRALAIDVSVSEKMKAAIDAITYYRKVDDIRSVERVMQLLESFKKLT